MTWTRSVVAMAMVCTSAVGATAQNPTGKNPQPASAGALRYDADGVGVAAVILPV